jgi:hypothetical protein
MPYFVTFGETSAAALDPNRDKPFELADAIIHAYQLLDDKMADVIIRDDKGNSLSGDDLRACWRGDKEITLDLKSVRSDAEDRGD